MTKLLIILAGILTTLMIQLNAQLASTIGNYQATVTIHLTGLILISTLCILSKKKKLDKDEVTSSVPIYMYTGGIIGVITVMTNNYSANYLGVTITLGIGLLIQTITSLVFDHLGFLGLPKNKFNYKKCIGLGFILIGIVAMFF